MKDFKIENGVLLEYLGNNSKIVIPKGVISIGNWAFAGCYKLKSINMPNSVTSIGSYAFFGCTKLTSIEIPDSVTSIDNWAFYDCKSLRSMNIPNSVTSIGDCVFKECINLESVKIPNSVTYIGNSAFYDCNNLVYTGKFKAFRIVKDKLKCRKKIYNEYRWNQVRGELMLCSKGIHYCTNLYEIFDYYYGEYGKDFVVCEIETKGEDLAIPIKSKHCCRAIKIKKRLSREELIEKLSNYEKEGE